MEWIKGKIISIEDIFESNKKIVLDKRKLELFLNGVNLKFDIQDGIYKIYNENEEFIGTADVKQGKLKRDVVI